MNIDKNTLSYLISNPNAIIRELCNRSFYHFVKEFWDQICNDEYVDNWHIEKLCNEFQIVAERVALGQKKEYDLIVNVPPGTSKSTILSRMFPAWCWTLWPWMKFICSSFASPLSLELADECRDLVKSPKYRDVYHDIKIRSDRDNKTNYKVSFLDPKTETWKSGGGRYSTSVGGTVTGFHAHIIIVDDPLDPKRAMSEVELVSAQNHMTQTLGTRKTNKAVSTTILLHQRLHMRDTTGHWLQNKKARIRHICLPGEIKNYASKLQPPEWAKYYKNGFLDHKRMDADILNDMLAELGQYGYHAQVGQDPRPPGGGMFKVANFVPIDHPDEFIRKDRVIGCIRYWDKAGTQDDGCNTAGVKMYKVQTQVGIKYVVSDVRKGQWATEERERIIRSTAEADGVDTVVWVEQEPGSGGKESAESTVRNLNGYCVYAERPTGDKVYRADPYSVQVNWGNVLLLRGDWNDDFIEEHRFFPDSGFKDQVDAASGAFNRLAGAKVAQVW